ncbi:hypothetical protein DL98DRAFT_553762 [Cadophora sp. DSE1049]|nr:hypothetical protein DL98DRAFT_553762 [Cadophora sp. DSE1049]
MYIATTLTLFLGLAAAAPGVAAPRTVPSKVKINGISLLGTGCPHGSADVQVDATGTLFEASFSAYKRKNCKLTINMEFDSSFQFTVFDTEIKGFHKIPSAAKGEYKNSWSPCGGQTAILNMNTQCNLHPTNLPALIAVDSVSGKLTVKFAVTWRHCPK